MGWLTTKRPSETDDDLKKKSLNQFSVNHDNINYYITSKIHFILLKCIALIFHIVRYPIISKSNVIHFFNYNNILTVYSSSLGFISSKIMWTNITRFTHVNTSLIACMVTVSHFGHLISVTKLPPFSDVTL